MSEHAEVLIVGAGLQGCSIALELARQGVETTLVDQAARPFERASLRNEGKIHLGLVYAADRSLDTARMQLEGALRFEQCVQRWIDLTGDPLLLSTPFAYLVARDSVIDTAGLTRHYEAVEELFCRALLRDPSLSYLGLRPDRLVRRLDPDEAAQWFPAKSVVAAFHTEERAVDTERLATGFRRAVDAEPLIRFVGGVRVDALARSGFGFTATGVCGGEPWQLRAEQAVNAAWESWAWLDQSLGAEPPQDLLLRLKYRVLVEPDDTVRTAPSATMVLGRYGDVVMRPQGPAYLSWYPAGMRGWTHSSKPPPEWAAACAGRPAEAERCAVLTGARAGIRPWHPAVADLPTVQVDAGVIVASGRTDVQDPASLLHQRSRIGLTSTRGYHSVNTGKLTTAPMFAMKTAEQVLAWREGLVATAS